MTSLTSTNVFTISCWSIEPPPPTPPPRFGKFSSTARCKALQSLYCTIRRLFVLFVDYSRTIRTIRRLFADYSHYSSTIRRLFVLFVDYSHYSHYSLHYSSFINCPGNTTKTRQNNTTLASRDSGNASNSSTGQSASIRVRLTSSRLKGASYWPSIT